MGRGVARIRRMLAVVGVVTAAGVLLLAPPSSSNWIRSGGADADDGTEGVPEVAVLVSLELGASDGGAATTSATATTGDAASPAPSATAGPTDRGPKMEMAGVRINTGRSASGDEDDGGGEIRERVRERIAEHRAEMEGRRSDG